MDTLDLAMQRTSRFWEVFSQWISAALSVTSSITHTRITGLDFAGKATNLFAVWSASVFSSLLEERNYAQLYNEQPSVRARSDREQTTGRKSLHCIARRIAHSSAVSRAAGWPSLPRTDAIRPVSDVNNLRGINPQWTDRKPQVLHVRTNVRTHIEREFDID